MLIDSNLIIYAVQAEYKNLREWIIDNESRYSIISRVEVLGYARYKPFKNKPSPLFWIIWKWSI